MNPSTASASSAASERAFSFLKLNERQAKPRTRGVTEIRGPYYLMDVLETMGGIGFAASIPVE